MPPAPDDDDEDDAAVRRRWLIRAIVGLGFGIPIAIEGRTFYRMIESYFFGDGGDDGGDGDDGDVDPVGVGDELLPETAAVETLADAVLYARSEGWRLEVTVEVENAGEETYTLQLRGITTGDGHRETDSATTGRILPGETGSVSAGWPVPTGDEPATLDVLAILEEDGETRTVEREVPLGQIPVSG